VTSFATFTGCIVVGLPAELLPRDTAEFGDAEVAAAELRKAGGAPAPHQGRLGLKMSRQVVDVLGEDGVRSPLN